MQTASSSGPNGLWRSITSRPRTGSPSRPSTASQAGSRTMSKPGWAACHCVASPLRSSRWTSTPRWSSLRRFSRRELVMRTPRESLSITSAPGRCTVRTEEVGCQRSPCGPRSWRSPASNRAATSGRCPSSRACQGWSGIGAVLSGRLSPWAWAVISSVAGTGRPPSVQADSVARTDRSTAIQFSAKEPCDSGE